MHVFRMECIRDGRADASGRRPAGQPLSFAPSRSAIGDVPFICPCPGSMATVSSHRTRMETGTERRGLSLAFQAQVCNIIQVDPSVPRFMPSSLAGGHGEGWREPNSKTGGHGELGLISCNGGGGTGATEEAVGDYQIAKAIPLSTSMIVKKGLWKRIRRSKPVQFLQDAVRDWQLATFFHPRLCAWRCCLAGLLCLRRNGCKHLGERLALCGRKIKERGSQTRVIFWPW